MWLSHLDFLDLRGYRAYNIYMSFWEIVILSIIQGITEFIPISSSGHLVIATHLLGLTDPENNLLLIVVLHFASLLAIVISFYDEIIEMLLSPRALLLVFVGTIPAGLVGYFFNESITKLFSSPTLVGICLFLTGIYILLSEMHWKRTPLSLEKSGIKSGLWVGIAQMFAILPGASRSGLTLATGLFCGLERPSAIKFSFLLAIPVIAGASILKLKDFDKLSVAFQPISIIVGFLICLVVSLLAIGFLVRMVRRGRLYYFACYCLIVGLGIILFI
ncbi:MAG: undecaprenyl-diphosphate phosphatase [Planctomycetota bacterium]|nr:undecaprenyl-diphosphate phosphatase [Planctomycetota bacterium]